MEDMQQVIREQAYRIWEQEGRPEGRQQEHWIRAERELEFRRMEDGGLAVEADHGRPKASNGSEEGPVGRTPKKPAKSARSATPGATTRKRKPAVTAPV